MKQKGIGTSVVAAIIVIIAIAGIGGYFALKGGAEKEGTPAPAEFEVSNLTFSPSEVEVGESVTISATVKNVGDLEGTYTVELKIDGVTGATKNVTLAGEATETVSFTIIENTAGTYTIGVNGLQRALNVLTPVTGDVWVAIWNDDYSYYDVSVFLNGEEIIHENRFANGYWGAFGDQPFEVTGTYELEVVADWAGGIDHWTDNATKTFIETVGDEPTHTYYGIEGIPVGTPDVLYVDGVWSKFYWIVIEDGDIELHY